MKFLKRYGALVIILILLLSCCPSVNALSFGWPVSIESYDRWIAGDREDGILPENFVDYHEKNLHVFGTFGQFYPHYYFRLDYHRQKHASKTFDYTYRFKDNKHEGSLLEVNIRHTLDNNIRRFIDNDPLGQTMLYQRTQVSGVVARERLNYYYVDGYLETIMFRIEGAEIHIDLTRQTKKGSPIPEVSMVKQLLSVDEEEFQEGYAILWDAMGGIVEYPSNFVVFLQMAWNFTLRVVLPVLVIGAIAFLIYKGIDRIKKHRWKKLYCS